MSLVLWKYDNPRVDYRTDEIHISLFNNRLTFYQDTNINITQRQNTAYKLWDGSYLLAKFLESKIHFGSCYWKAKNVIELGSGCGLVSLAAWLLGAKVIATDLPQVLSHTRACITKNVKSIASNKSLNCDKIFVDDYTWGKSKQFKSFSNFQVILASDVIYERENLNDLIQALKDLSNKETAIWISYKPRGLGEDVFFDLINNDFEINHIKKCELPQEFQQSQYKIINMKRTS
ncbi:unnamed protein product [Dimorphilus gyrociliatus]|uniref:Uncharacterized protein n=1 Tax=Dimorphilus gyrociliatus TaxID=2664684 RepID=A0A7I8VA66_9ANNE|nr:unnamed protein product [Dimorphilus gyrociliatus]